MQKLGRIAFITTPEYRDKHPEEIEDFVYRHLYFLCNWFEVICTGRTYSLVISIANRSLDQVDPIRISEGTQFPIDDPQDLLRWQKTIEENLVPVQPSIKGMIELTYELVEGRLDAIIHLTDWADVTGKPDSMVLRREANVHNLPIASDINTAAEVVTNWKSLIAKNSVETPLFPKKVLAQELPLSGITPENHVLALIAHDQMNLEMCCFVVEHARRLFNEFDYILATDITGEWVKRFALAAGRSDEEISKVRCCLSGSYGGYIQIAAAVVKKLCRKVIFLQDPFTSHAHETDIRLFEQAVLLFERAAVHGVEIELATNIASAKAILGL